MNNIDKPRVLIYSQAFYPDHSGIPIYSTDFAFYCLENGYEVDVITGYPFYPSWQKNDEDKFKLFSKDNIKGASVYRGYMYVNQNPTSFERILHEITLVLFAFLNSFRVKRPDIIVVFTTPILLGVLAAFMNIFWRRKLVINVQDFQIEAACSLGMLDNNIFIKFLKKLEIWSYKMSDYVTSISPKMVNMLVEFNHINSSKVLLWPNWLQQSINSDVLVKGSFRKRFSISEDVYLVGYAGNIGRKQGLEILIDVACKFDDNPDLLFLIIGEGSGLNALKEYADKKNVNNVRFLPFIDKQLYNEYLFDINAVFISQIKVDFDVYFPSKLLNIMDYGRLIIISADAKSELYTTMYNNNLALVADYGDVKSIYNFITDVINDISISEKYILQSMKYINRFERNLVLSDLMKCISGVELYSKDLRRRYYENSVDI